MLERISGWRAPQGSGQSFESRLYIPSPFEFADSSKRAPHCEWIINGAIQEAGGTGSGAQKRSIPGSETRICEGISVKVPSEFDGNQADFLETQRISMANNTRMRLGEVADLLDVSADTVRRWVDSGKLKATRSEGGHREIEGKDLAKWLATNRSAASLPGAPRQSARNSFRGLITKVTKDRVVAQVEIQSGPHRLVSLMTREAVDELGLEPGMEAVASVKATQVVVSIAAHE